MLNQQLFYIRVLLEEGAEIFHGVWRQIVPGGVEVLESMADREASAQDPESTLAEFCVRDT